MKTIKFIYYATTGIISGMMLFIAFETLTKPEVKVSMAHLGFRIIAGLNLEFQKLLVRCFFG